MTILDKILLFHVVLLFSALIVSAIHQKLWQEKQKTYKNM